MQLLNGIKNTLSWNDNLEVVIRNQVIPNSNIVQLLLHATHQSNNRSYASVPVGWKEFSEFLGQTYRKDSLAPKFAKSINNNNLYEIKKWATIV